MTYKQDPEWTKVKALASKDNKTALLTVLHIFSNIEKNMDTTKRKTKRTSVDDGTQYLKWASKQNIKRLIPKHI